MDQLFFCSALPRPEGGAPGLERPKFGAGAPVLANADTNEGTCPGFFLGFKPDADTNRPLTTRAPTKGSQGMCSGSAPSRLTKRGSVAHFFWNSLFDTSTLSFLSS